MKITKIFLFLPLCFSNIALGDGCEYDYVVAELKKNCTGINAELQKIKTRETVNAVVTGVGTVAAGGALYAGIKKKDFDKKAEDLMKQMENIDNMSDEDFVKFLKNMAAYQEMKEEYDSMCQIKRGYEEESKRLGNIRTGLIAGNTVTAITGTILSSETKKTSDSIQDMIQKCLDTIKNSEPKIGQARIDCGYAQYEKLKKVVSNCGALSTENMEKLSKTSTASAVVSGVNIATGFAGTITSVLGNKNEYDQKTKNLNTAANVMAGTSTVASGVATVLNAVTVKSINNNIQASESCEETISEL